MNIFKRHRSRGRNRLGEQFSGERLGGGHRASGAARETLHADPITSVALRSLR